MGYLLLSIKDSLVADLQSKVVIITGASSGIGAALARSMSREGVRVTLAARRIDRLKEVRQACSGENLIVKADILKEEDRRAIVQQTLDRWGRVDILINNAGIGIYGDFMEIAEGDWRKLFDINLFGTVFLTQAVLPTMQAQGQGLIINIASIGGLIAHSDKVTPYVACKHAVVGFSRGLAKDLADTGIRVLVVCPHLTATDFFSVSPGADEMAPVVEKYKEFMDTPEKVAQGIIRQLDSDRLVVFPTDTPAKAYERQRDI